MSRWDRLESGFAACHTRPGNVAAHLVTTPAGLFATASLLARVHPWAAVAAAAGWSLALLPTTPLRWWAPSALGLLGVALIAAVSPLGGPSAVALLVLAYVGQELAHVGAGEPTFQSTYQGATPRWWVQLVGHTLHLPPLLLASALRVAPGLARLIAPPLSAVRTHLDSEEQRRDQQIVGEWSRQNLTTTAHTTHWWLSDLPPDVRAAFDRLARDPKVIAALREPWSAAFTVEVLDGMNEIYVAAPAGDLTSDRVFYMRHVDGPWAIWPGAAVYRGLIAVSPNVMIRTHFPLDHPDDARNHVVLTMGDVLAFDFNRTPHFISKDPERTNEDLRIVLKVHYAVYPSWLPRYGRMLGQITTGYDIVARKLFLATLAPTALVSRFSAFMVLAWTVIFEWVARNIGPTNLVYVALLGGLSAATGSTLPLLLGAGYVHYLLYLSVWALRDGVSWGTFLRDAVFYKTVSYGTLFAIYAWNFELSPLSLAAIFGGFGLSASAASALGVVRTYFGTELGLVEPKRVSGFPYNVVPHPMIVGGMLGLVGIWLMPGFRHAHPWVIPLHLAFYLAHLTQEIFDLRVHRELDAGPVSARE